MENMTIVYTKSFDRPCEKAVEPVCDMTGSQVKIIFQEERLEYCWRQNVIRR
jgi:hypothetical protein